MHCAPLEHNFHKVQFWIFTGAGSLLVLRRTRLSVALPLERIRISEGITLGSGTRKRK